MSEKDLYVTVRDEGQYPSKALIMELIKQVIYNDLSLMAEDVIYNSYSFENAKQALDYLLKNSGAKQISADDVFYDDKTFSNVDAALSYLMKRVKDSSSNAESISYDDSNVKAALDDLKNSLNRLLSNLNLPLDATQVNYGDTTVNQKIQEIESKIGSTGNGVNGAVFVTNITPQSTGNNIGEKKFDGTGNVLLECKADTNFINVSVMAITGNTHLRPEVTVNGNKVYLEGTTDFGKYVGNIDIDLQGGKSVTVRHEDGPKFTVNIIRESKPKVLNMEFVNGYPGDQTELKEGDNFDLYIESDTEIANVMIDNSGACKANSFMVNTQTKETTITTTIADRGTTAEFRPAKVKVQSPSGSWSDWFTSTEFGSIEGKHTVKCNNLYPSINIGDIIYSGNNALKTGETATVNNTVSNFDVINYSSPTSELDITYPSSYEQVKEVSYKSGDYNFGVSNFKITAIRNANNATSSNSAIVNIDNLDTSLDLSVSSNRLRSSQDGLAHTITINSNKDLGSAPVLSTPVGSWIGDFSGGPKEWTAKLVIDDSIPKGEYSFSLESATTTTGEDVNSISGDTSFVVGGFASRQIQFTEAYSRLAPIGTSVTDTSKLECIALGGTEFTYQNSLDMTTNTFTITDSEGNLDPTGDHVFITHSDWNLLNSSGSAYVELEEKV